MSVKVESHKQWHMDLTYLGTISKMHASINHSEYTTKASSLSRSSLTETPVYLFFFFISHTHVASSLVSCSGFLICRAVRVWAGSHLLRTGWAR